MVALNALVELFHEGLERGAAGVGPYRQLEHVDASAPGLAAADDVLADLHPRRQLHLTEPSIRPEGVELLKEQLVLVTVKRASHPAAGAYAAAQDQSEVKLFESAIIWAPDTADFVSLIRLYGRDARGAITGITLIAGFASTVGWPFSAALEHAWGWRGACWVWAGLDVHVGLTLNAWLPRAKQLVEPTEASQTSTQRRSRGKRLWPLPCFWPGCSP